MTENVDILTFVEARLDEDEQVARAAACRTAGVWEVRPHSGPPVSVWSTGERHDVPQVSGTWAEPGAHIARHDPARVLAEVAAKRVILGMCVRPPEVDDDGDLYIPGGGGYGEAWVETLLALVQVYSGHPDFDPAWRLP